MRRLAWLTHREWAPIGGAESADIEMANRRPDDVEITVIWPGGVDEHLYDFDHVVVSGFYGFKGPELQLVRDVGHKTTLWLHDVQMAGHWLLTSVAHVVFCTPGHMDYELNALGEGTYLRSRHINPGYMNVQEILDATSDLQYGERENALWAHRPVAHKGLDLAVEWATEKNVTLDVLVGRPRQQVWRAMAQHRYFLLLSHIFDAGPRAVMEAQILGCELVLNDNVGWFDESALALRERLEVADRQFWEVALA